MTICSAVFIQYQRVTDRQTDRRTDRQNCYINIARLLTRNKNDDYFIMTCYRRVATCTTIVININSKPVVKNIGPM